MAVRKTNVNNIEEDREQVIFKFVSEGERQVAKGSLRDAI